MQIAGNILIFLLLPVTLAASFALRDQYRVGGSDAVGPMLIMVLATGLRWLLAGILIVLCVGRGGFDGLVPIRVLQALIVAGVIFAIDATAWMAVTALSRSERETVLAQEVVGLFFGHALPILIILALLIPLNAPEIPTALTLWGATAVLLLSTGLTFSHFNAINLAALERKAHRFDAQEAARNRLVRTYTVTLDAIPPDAPAERYQSYFDDPQCPEEARHLVEKRLMLLPDLDAQLLTMLADDRSGYSMKLISRTYRLFQPAQIAAVIDASVRLAHACRDRLAKSESAAVTECVDNALLAVYLANARSVPGVDHRPSIAAWHDALSHVPSKDNAVLNARREVDQWLEFNARRP